MPHRHTNMRFMDQARQTSTNADVLDRLRRLGHDIGSVWDLTDVTPEVVDVLAAWLQETNNGVFNIERLGAANRLVLPPRVARKYWALFVSLFREERDPLVRAPLGAAVGEALTRETLTEYQGLLGDQTLGDDRIMLVRGLKRLRGPERDAALAQLRDDPLFHAVLGTVLHVEDKGPTPSP